jgi:hypothetical protein
VLVGSHTDGTVSRVLLPMTFHLRQAKNDDHPNITEN